MREVASWSPRKKKFAFSVALIVSVLGLRITAALLKTFYNAIGYLLSLATIENDYVLWVCIPSIILAITLIAIFKRSLIGEAFQFIGLAAIQIWFLMWYYLKFHNLLHAKLDFLDERLLYLLQTSLLVFVVAVLYFGAGFVFGPAVKIWKSYLIITLVGSLVICGSLATQPFQAFSKDTDHAGNKIDEISTAEAEETYGKPKYWYLENKEGVIIDVSSHPGFSGKFGKAMKPVDPERVEAVMEYMKKNSKLFSFLDKGLDEAVLPNKTKTAQAKDYKVYGPGDDPGFRLREGTDTDHYIRFTEEVHYDFYSGVNEDQYELLPRNEKPIRVWAGDKIPNNLREFKIRAKKNVIVEIGIKPYSATLAMAR